MVGSVMIDRPYRRTPRDRPIRRPREDLVPLVQIDLLEGRTPEQKKALLAAVTEAVHTSIGAPLPSIRVWLREFSPEDYMAEGVWQPDKG